MTRLIVAAGGGGDAVAAAMLHAALYGDDGPAVILTYAWDRLLIKPVPGPLSQGDFTGLRSLATGVWAVPADAAPVPPARSTLPRLAAELPHTFALLDPHGGAVGMARQVRELIAHLAPESVDLLDTGGDILAHGDELTLLSPLGDALSLAACSQVDAPMRLLVAGPGLDGELPAEQIRDRLGPVVRTLGAKHVAAVHSVLGWHPSQAVALLAATARGIRGSCELAGAGPAVPLTDEGPTVHLVGLDAAFAGNQLARDLAATTTLEQAERIARRICGRSEIDDERRRGAASGGRAPHPEFDAEAALARLGTFEDDARARGVTHATFHRIAEALGIDEMSPEQRQRLISAAPQRYTAPLWRIAA